MLTNLTDIFKEVYNMSYEIINPINQFNYQINRVLTYGNIACNIREVREKTASIQTLSDWDRVWSALGEKAEQEKQYLHAAYYYRMVEFFLMENNKKKKVIYKKCIDNFYRAFDTELHLNYEQHNIPFDGGVLNCIKLAAEHPKETIIICGGYDSFIEEFVLQVNDLVLQNYDVILFEGPGQGRCLQQNMYFRYDFEKPTIAVLDYFNIKHCSMVGISWGGYLALRSAAFEKRITSVVAFDIMDNGFEVMTNIFPTLICKIIRLAYYHKNKRVLNFLTGRLRKRSLLANWAISQGMYITGTKTSYDFYKKLSEHNLNGIYDKITQDVLLLAGEKDHYIPINQFYRLKENLLHTKSLTCRIFTKAEGGEQHCQVGNHLLALNTIVSWMNSRF